MVGGITLALCVVRVFYAVAGARQYRASSPSSLLFPVLESTQSFGIRAGVSGKPRRLVCSRGLWFADSSLVSFLTSPCLDFGCEVKPPIGGQWNKPISMAVKGAQEHKDAILSIDKPIHRSIIGLNR